MRLKRCFTLAPFAGLLGLALAPSSCRTLDPIALDQCGNQVVEASLGEDCDGASTVGRCSNYNPDTGTIIDGAVCKFACTAGDLNSGCPVEGGFACGSDGICRRPSGSFKPGPSSIDAAATRLVAQPLGAGLDRSLELFVFDDTDLGIYRFDTDGRVTDVQSVPARGRELAVGEFTQADDPSIALRFEASPTAIGIALFDVAEDGALKPVNVRDEDLTLDAGQNSILFTAQATTPSVDQFLMSYDEQGLRAWDKRANRFVRVWDDVNIDKASFGGLAVGDVFQEQARCDEVALAPTREIVKVFALCDDTELQNNVTDEFDITFPPSPAPMVQVGLNPAENIDERIRRPSIFFVREPGGDDLVDVLVFGTIAEAEQGRMLISRQVEVMMGRNVFEAEFSPLPELRGHECQGLNEQDIIGTARPLAFADFNQDGTPDVVTEVGVYISRDVVPVRYQNTVCGDFRWHAAMVADFNGDGVPDLLVQDQERFMGMDQVGTSLVALINNGVGSFTHYRITDETVADFEVADLDGDGVDDIAYSLDFTLQTSASVFVSYGQASGGPTTGKSVGEFANGIAQIAAGRFQGDDGAADLVVVDALATDETGRAAHRLLLGSGSRQLVAPVLFEETETLSPSGISLQHVPGLLTSSRLSSDFDPPDILLSLASYRRTLPMGGLSFSFPSVWTAELAQSDQPFTNFWAEAEAGLDTNDILGVEDIALVASIDLDEIGGDETHEVVVMFPGFVEVYTLDILDPRGADVLPAGTLIEVPVANPLFSAPEPLVVDLDEDGLNDILYFSGYTDGDGIVQTQLTLLRNRGEGPFSATPFDVSSVLLEAQLDASEAEFSILPPALARLRLDADDRPDLAVVGSDIGVVNVVDGQLVYEVKSPNPLEFPQAAAGGDFNGDGVDDLALGIGSQVQILLGVDFVDRSDDDDVSFEDDDEDGPVDEPVDAQPE